VSRIANRSPWRGLLAVSASVALMRFGASSVSAQEPANTNRIIPLIVMDEVPLSDAIANLARQAGINYILDPQLAGLTATVNGRWTNATAEQVLGTTLQQHGFIMIQAPSNSATLIVPTNQTVKPPDTNAGRATTNSLAPANSLPSGK
jgi:type II secretory pathway component GspD/PulD (secretin)